MEAEVARLRAQLSTVQAELDSYRKRYADLAPRYDALVVSASQKEAELEALRGQLEELKKAGPPSAPRTHYGVYKALLALAVIVILILASR
jgi:cytochrome c-type biogenesis protein CcmH/NrfG